MKTVHPFLQKLLWGAAVMIISGVIIVGIFTNITVRSIEKNLPVMLLKELHSLAIIHEDIAEIVITAERTKNYLNPDNLNLFRAKVDAVYKEVAQLRETYVLDNLIHASAFHAVVAPAIADLQIWLSEGVSGFSPESDITIYIALNRISEAFQKSKDLNFYSRTAAQNMLNDQRKRLDQFLFSANLLFALTTIITFGMVLLLIHLHSLQKREMKIQTELLNQRDLLNSLFDNLLLGVSVWNNSGELIKINKGFTDLTGYTLDDIQNLEIWFSKAYPDPEYRNYVLEDWKRSIHQKEAVREFKICCCNQQFKNIEFRGSFLSDGRALVTLSDITERKLTEEKIKQSENQFRAIFEYAPVGMAIVDHKGWFIDVNSQFCSILGYRSDEITAMAIDLITHPDDRQECRTLREQLLKGEINVFQTERKFLHKEGRTIWGITSSTLIFENNSRPAFFLIHLSDISSLKKAQEDKEHLEKQLQQAHKMEAIGTLAGGIAHDFNNLLMGIQGRASLLLLHLTESDPQYRHVKCIEEYVQSAANLTMQLLGFARGGKYEVKPMDLNEVVLATSSMFGKTKKEIRLHTKLEKNLPFVQADRRQIEQVLINMYVNAWQAMPGGGDLYIETQNTQLDDSTCRAYQITPGTYAKISITDTGIGMDEATCARIFDPFFTTKEKKRGAGLGLASAYGIIRNHGGMITVFSEKGRGASFHIYLPSSEKNARQPLSDITTIPPEIKNKTVLLVDDESVILDVGESLLEILGVKTIIAKSGQQAVDIVKQKGNDIDLVILDLILQDMDGGEVFDIINKINPNLAVLLSSGYAIDKDTLSLIERGCRGFIQKPFTISELSKKIQEILNS